MQGIQGFYMETEKLKIDQLIFADYNPRSISKERFENLKQSLKTDPDFMKVRPVIVNKDMTIIAGNMRVRAAKELGWSDVECIQVDVSKEQEKLWNLKDNNQWGEFDDQMLSELLYSLKSLPEVALIGFNQKDLDLHLSNFEPVASDAVERLDEMTKKDVECPECGHVFKA